MTEYFQEITQCFVTLAISDSVVNPNLPDYSTSTYASLGREIRYVPESTSPMLPNFIPYGPSARQIGRFYPTGTSAPTYSVDDLKPLQTTGLVKTQITVGRWMAICDNENCLDDCAEGFWEKHVVWTSRPSKSLRRSNPWEDVPNAIARSKSMYLEFDCGSRQVHTFSCDDNITYW